MAKKAKNPARTVRKSAGTAGKLTAKRKSFADIWLADPTRNGTKAYRTVYPTVKSDHVAGAAAARLLADVKVQAYIVERLAILEEKVLEKTAVDEAWVRDRMASLADPDIRKLYNEDGTLKAIHELDDETARRVAAVKVTLQDKGETTVMEMKTHNPEGALRDLGRHLGMFKEDNKQAAEAAAEAEARKAETMAMSDLEFARRLVFLMEKPFRLAEAQAHYDRSQPK